MFKNPYQSLQGGEWKKVNFHTHAGTGPNTCGQTPLDQTIELYKDLGYGALCISNHDLFTDTKSLSDEKMLLVPGVEYSQHGHMLTIGVNESLHDFEHQEAINRTSESGGFTILCHPNWMYKEYWACNKALAINGYMGLEVINMLIYRLNGSGLATDLWDYLLQNGRLVFGFGNDDFHRPFDTGRSYNDVYVSGNQFEDYKFAIKNGCFTASTGIRLEYLTIKDNLLEVKAKHPTETYVDTFTYRFISEEGIVKTSTGSDACLELKNENYIRVEVIAEQGAMLFSQPVWNDEFFIVKI